MLRIAIEDIPDGVSDLELTCKVEEIDLEAEAVNFIDPVTVKLNLFKHDDKVYVKAESSVAMESECAKCLAPVHEILETSSENQYRPLPEMSRYSLDDIGIRYYTEEYIDLTEDLRENLLLEVPVRILCSEDCKGLCSSCGQDLNKGKCDCCLEPEEPRDSRFADLVKMLEINGKLEV
jgi:uncharacterized protein